MVGEGIGGDLAELARELQVLPRRQVLIAEGDYLVFQQSLARFPQHLRRQRAAGVHAFDLGS
jgi:hypothetical protein